MSSALGNFFIWFVSYRTDRFLIIVFCGLIFFLLCNYARIARVKQGKMLFGIACVFAVVGIGLTAGVYWTRPTHGLSGRYYANTAWIDDGTELERFFETNGRRVDRFIDFHPNDFNNEYPFTWQPFSVQWHGYMFVPKNGYQLYSRANMGHWFYVDDELVEGNHQIDFGTSQARTYLREGWSYDERWGNDQSLTFVWGTGARSEFYLGIDEVTDYRLIFRCFPFMYKGGAQREITIFLAEKLLGSVKLKEGWHTYDIPVPRLVLQNLTPGFFRVKFVYSHVVRPSEVLKQSQETRQLTAAFDFATLQKLSSDKEQQSVEMLPETFPQSPFLSAGTHAVTLKVLTEKAQDVSIQLVWQQQHDALGNVIPEDFLFPDTLPPEKIYRTLSQERMWLGVSIFYKIIGCLFLGSLVVIALATSISFQQLLTWENFGIAAIGLFAFVIRLAFILEMRHLDPNFEILPRGADHLTYVLYARGFFRGYWPRFLHAPFYGAPLISFYFIVCSMLFGENLFMIRLITALLTTGSVLLTYGIAKQAFNRSIAYIAAIMCACNGVLIFYDTSLLIAPLLTFLSLLSLYFMEKLSKGCSVKTAILLGISLGLTVLARANIFLIMPFLLLWMLFYFPGKIFHKIGYYVLICIVMLLTILPVTIRNFYSTKEHPFVLINGNGGFMLWMGNNPSSNGTTGYSLQLLAEVRNRIKTTGSSYVDEVFRYIKEQPLDYLQLEYKKLNFFWRGYEIGNLIPYYVFRAGSKILSLPWLNFVLIGPLGIVGMALVVKKWKDCFILYSYVLIQLLSALMFVTVARYRLPVVPALTIFAAYTAWYVIQSFQNKQWYKFGIVIGLFIVLYVVLNYFSAARLYHLHHGEPMPFVKAFRYWDLFHTF